MADRLNLQNIYIDLLNKMKTLSAADHDYIDHLISLVRVDMGLMDNDISAIEALIPDNATVLNKLSTITDFPQWTGPGYHNSIYRGKDLGNSVTDDQWAMISAGTFDDIFIGDYWTINNIKWRVAHFNYWAQCGDAGSGTSERHVVIIPATSLYSKAMNDTATSAGGYAGSKMRSDYLADALTLAENAFGASHILNHRVRISNSVTDGAVDNADWYDSKIDLLNEIMCYGCMIASKAHTGNEAGVNKEQLAIFRNMPSVLNIRSTYWLQGVSSDTNFCTVNLRGIPGSSGANNENGVRPCFAIYNPTT